MPAEKARETAYFAAGCFWMVEAAFRKIDGVFVTEVGYMGGKFPGPSYHDVSCGLTGHAETVKVVFDPAVVVYESLLETFWTIHDPMTKNRQGPDIGTQYRSVIFTTTPAQEAAARASRDRVQERLGREVVTEIVPAPVFYRAEEYHQQYFEKKGGKGCRL
ncbi:MAG: peptide-methionine (S)-S-oxide reductase MsrA [Methanomicrobiaceae archaeon]|nr:peptide-methionine (S)-S-oxide reductase MsrA [Methanomicrobiaceae archaeon]